MEALVSIITPNYNAIKFVDKTIQSILNQTYQHWELLIIDDVSTDGSLAIIKEYCKNDDRIRLLQLKENSGPAIARNTGIEESKGAYIAFLDSDDRWAPKKLEAHINFMQLKKCVLSHSHYYSVNEDFDDLLLVKSKKEVTYQDLLTNNYIGCLTAIYHVEKLGKVYFPLIKKRQDWALWLKITKMGYTSFALEKPLAFYTRRVSSVSSNKYKLIAYNWKVYRDIEHFNLIKSIYYLSILMFKKILK